MLQSKRTQHYELTLPEAKWFFCFVCIEALMSEQPISTESYLGYDVR